MPKPITTTPISIVGLMQASLLQPWPVRALVRRLSRIGAVLFCLSLSGCSGGGIYANVGIAGPSVDLGPVSIHTGVNLGRWL
jgi:predicted outer membrane repeat protein